MNRSQADINKNIDMIAARRQECEFFATNPDYRHLAGRMGSEYLAKLLSKVVFVSPYISHISFSQFMFVLVVVFILSCLFIDLFIFLS